MVFKAFLLLMKRKRDFAGRIQKKKKTYSYFDLRRKKKLIESAQNKKLFTSPLYVVVTLEKYFTFVIIESIDYKNMNGFFEISK